MGNGTEILDPKTQGEERSPNSLPSRPRGPAGEWLPPSTPLHIDLVLTWKSSTWPLGMAEDEGSPHLFREPQDAKKKNTTVPGTE